MSRFYRKKLNAQGRYINPPVHAKQKPVKSRITTGSETKLYKFERGPLKETTAERTIRIAKEAEARYYARQAEKEANPTQKRRVGKKPYESGSRREYGQNPAVKARAKELRALRKASNPSNPTEPYVGPLTFKGLTAEEIRLKRNAYMKARYARIKKRNNPEACVRAYGIERLGAEAKTQSTSLVITITITDPNKS